MTVGCSVPMKMSKICRSGNLPNVKYKLRKGKHIWAPISTYSSSYSPSFAFQNQHFIVLHSMWLPHFSSCCLKINTFYDFILQSKKMSFFLRASKEENLCFNNIKWHGILIHKIFCIFILPYIFLGKIKNQEWYGNEIYCIWSYILKYHFSLAWIFKLLRKKENLIH